MPLDVNAVGGACPHDRSDNCSMPYRVDGDRLLSVRGNPDHPDARGRCVTSNRYEERVNRAERRLRPQRRGGPKGGGEFAPIGWAGALAEIASRRRAPFDAHGPPPIPPYCYTGKAGMPAAFADTRVELSGVG